MSSAWDTWPTFFNFFDSCPTVQFSQLDDNPAEFFVSMIMAITGTLPFVTIIILGLLMLFTCKRRYETLLIVLIVPSVITEMILKPYFHQARPPLACITSYGMPSGHATLSGVFICWALFAYHNKIITNFDHIIVIWLLSINNAFSRIYLNYHTKEQVVAGFIWGFISCALILMLMPIQKQQEVKRQLTVPMYQTGLLIEP